MQMKTPGASMFRRDVFLPNVWCRCPLYRSQKRHIFVLGGPRSGTTLLKTILCAHPNLAGTDYESTGVFFYRDIFHYADPEIDAAAVKSSLAAAQGFAGFYDGITSWKLEQLGKKRFVDKPVSQDRLALALYPLLFPRACLINIIRNGMDCFCSARKHPNVPQKESLEYFARFWKKRVATRLKPWRHGNVRDVRYEDLVSDPETTVRGLMDFVGEPYEAEQLNSLGFKSLTRLHEVEHHKNLGRQIGSFR